jgi:hypothetical protein
MARSSHRKQINITAPPLTHQQLRELADKLGLSMAGVIALALDRLHQATFR